MEKEKKKNERKMEWDSIEVFSLYNEIQKQRVVVNHECGGGNEGV